MLSRVVAEKERVVARNRLGTHGVASDALAAARDLLEDAAGRSRGEQEGEHREDRKLHCCWSMGPTLLVLKVWSGRCGGLKLDLEGEIREDDEGSGTLKGGWLTV